MQRLDKFLSDSKVASRRELRQIIRAGRVRVGERVVREPEYKVDEKNDEIFLDGVRVGGARRIVLMFHKPAGFVTSTADPRDRTVMELLPPQYRDLTPVGRLDKDTEGLLLFTNDGQLAHRLISPRRGVENATTPSTRAQPTRRTSRPSARAWSCATGRSAFRRGWSRRDRGKASSTCARGSIIRCGGCSPAGESLSRICAELLKAACNLESFRSERHVN